MVMGSHGAVGNEMSAAVKKLAGDISRKTGERYSQVVSGIRTRFAFWMTRLLCACGGVDLSGSASRIMH